MKKRDILNLIRCHSEHNDNGFRDIAIKVAEEFESQGDFELAEYVMALISGDNSLVPQGAEKEIDFELQYLEKLDSQTNQLLLPEKIIDDIKGIINAIERTQELNKFLFQGAPGTGKTEAVKQIARLLKRPLYSVKFSTVIDSKLGQTQKNLVDLFKEIKKISLYESVVIIFDEIDALVMDRASQNDLREMGRATSTFLKCLDQLSENAVLFATTNLFIYFDKALIRRFDFVVDFNRYSFEDLLDISERILEFYSSKFNFMGRDIRLFRKIMRLQTNLIYPGDLKNIIRTSIAFSDRLDSSDFFRRLYSAVCLQNPTDVACLRDQGFTVREIEILTSKSKSSVARELSNRS